METTFNEDFRELIIALSDTEARFMVVGGYAVAVHGRPRATKDLDVWVEPTLENAHRVLVALADFGAAAGDLTAEDLATPDTGFMMGRPPTRIDTSRGSKASSSTLHGREPPSPSWRRGVSVA